MDIQRISEEMELTRFMNKGSYTAEEIKLYPYDQRKEYSLWTSDPSQIEPIRIYATGDNCALEYARELYDLADGYELIRVEYTFTTVSAA